MRARVFALLLAFILESPLAQASEKLSIGADHGTIDFAIGDSKIFRTTGSFKSWQGALSVDDTEVPRSTVEVVVHTESIEMLDTQQTAMLKDSDFFDVEKFPKMIFESKKIERTGEDAFKFEGNITLRGITRPMTLEASVTDRRPDAAPGRRVATFRAEGSLKRSEYGMIKYIDFVGDKVDIAIRADAWR